ncbi:EAL domain-containing protein [Marinobacter sp. CHS3-4]|uniref:sensor domain-containing phosphodiesterase n=1 Tax=Marinobacter sp. CHS3-4 TaxID=3045174 RepID=UPI0024B5610B|nr:EAL domain-containing protein [Marinobacter sp. CHS3-4]MDI9245614.1 EAL domain-containing protein [Marinobacter sp. CHS3-4]
MTSGLVSLRSLDWEQAKALLLFSAVVVCLAELSRFFSIDEPSMSILWPATGLILGAGLILRWSVVLTCGPLLFVWLLVAQDQTVGASIALTVSQVAGIAFALWYLQRQEAPGNRFKNELVDRLVYLKAGALAATVSASLGTFAFWLGDSSIRDFKLQDVFLVYWLLEIVSIFLLAPVAYFILENPSRFFRNVTEDIKKTSTAFCIGIAVSLALILFALPSSADQTYTLALSFLVFPTLCWLVLTAHPSTVTLALPLVSFVAVAFLSLGIGPVARLTTIDEVVQLLLLLAGSVLLLQIIAAITYLRNGLTQRLRQQASTDFLSGLNNDRAFIDLIRDRVPETEKAAETSNPSSWLIYLEVLDFDHLEDLMGFRARRKMETLFSARLMGAAGPACDPARIGNGIYSLLFTENGRHSLPEFLQFLYRRFDGELFSVEDHQTRIRVSIGAVALDGSLQDPNQYLSAATQAALMARDHLPRIHTIEDPEAVSLSRIGLTQRLELLKDALSDERLVLFAQPILPFRNTEEGISYEILLRLRGTDGQFVSPGVFLPVAEAYGFMKQIDLWVIRTTLRLLAENPDWLSRTQKCSINLAGTSLSSTEIVSSIEEAFQDTGVPFDKIGFEVTETQRISSRDEAEIVTAQLRDMGCSVSLDDFGTGLATFDYLKTFRFDTLKIDGAFVKQIETNEDDRQIVGATCVVARSMGLTTVAEFVENERVAELLADLGVDYGQGFGLGRPVPLADLFETKMEKATAR